MLSPGALETGGFYTFGGSWSEQTNQGISFLTSKTDITESVSRLKTAELGGAVLLIWEVWSRTAYNRSEYMVVDTNGAVLQSEASLAYHYGLPFADDLQVINGKAVAYVGSRENQLVRLEFCYQNCAVPNEPDTTSGPGTGAGTQPPGDAGTQPPGDLTCLAISNTAIVSDTSNGAQNDFGNYLDVGPLIGLFPFLDSTYTPDSICNPVPLSNV